MPKYRVMFVMPVSCVVEVEVGDDMVDDEEIADAAYKDLPGFTDQYWDASDAEAFDGRGEPYMIELVED